MQRYLLLLCIVAIGLITSGLGLASPGPASSGLASEFASQDGATSKLTVQVAGARNSKGQIAVALFHDEAGFPGDKSKAFRTLQVRIDPQTLRAQVTLDNLPAGVYAVSVFHDENMNSRLDKNVFGI